MGKPRRVRPYTQNWWREANALARSFAPPIYPCADCGGPVLRGYCCERCGSAEPEPHDAARERFVPEGQDAYFVGRVPRGHPGPAWFVGHNSTHPPLLRLALFRGSQEACVAWVHMKTIGQPTSKGT